MQRRISVITNAELPTYRQGPRFTGDLVTWRRVDAWCMVGQIESGMLRVMIMVEQGVAWVALHTWMVTRHTIHRDLRALGDAHFDCWRSGGMACPE
jgi:hypothetical protein